MTERIQALVEGGKASAGPPLGPALGPLGVNIGEIVNAINEKTKEYAGMQVPVTVEVDPQTKKFDIKVGSPPVSALLKKEAKIEKGSGSPKDEKVADIIIEQLIKIAKMKEDSIPAKDTKARVKSVVGTCVSMGILVEGKDPKEALKEIDEGVYDQKIESGVTEISEERLKELEEEKQKLAEDAAKAHAEEDAKATKIMADLEGEERSVIKTALKEAEISTATINRLLPAEVEAEGEAPEAAEKETPEEAGEKKEGGKESGE